MAKIGDVPRQIQKIVKQEVGKIVLKTRRTDLSDMGRLIIKAMKLRISEGKSTIRGEGLFPAYKQSYKDVIKRGRGNFKTKRVAPVNLKVSGKFLKALTFKLRRGTAFPTLRIGFFKKKELQKERGHRTGHNQQRKRPIVPQGDEEFVKPIQKIINSELDRIAKKLSK